MRLVTCTEPGTVELSFMWLPAFLAYDVHLRAVIDHAVDPMLVGKEVSEELLDKAHDRVVELICEAHPGIKGLEDYLNAIKFVEGPK